MPLNLGPSDRFPDLALPDTAGETVRLSALTRPGVFDRQVGFTDGYPLIVHSYRGFFCPRDQRQFRGLVEVAGDLAVNYGKLGNGTLARDDGGADVFFNFTAIPGSGDRTLRPAPACASNSSPAPTG